MLISFHQVRDVSCTSALTLPLNVLLLKFRHTLIFQQVVKDYLHYKAILETSYRYKKLDYRPVCTLGMPKVESEQHSGTN